MPGATPRGYPYPLGTEPADGSANIEALARAVDGDLTGYASAQELKGQAGVLTFTKSSGFTDATNMPLPYASQSSTTARFSEVAGGSGTSIELKSAGLYLLTLWLSVAVAGDSHEITAAGVVVGPQTLPVFAWIDTASGAFNRFYGSAGVSAQFLSPSEVLGTVVSISAVVGVVYLGS